MNGMYDHRREHDACGVGFVARLDGVPGHQVVLEALQAMGRLAHRGGHGEGDDTGDGAGILLPLPRAFFLRQWPTLGQEGNNWAVGQLFLPREAALRASLLGIASRCLSSCGFSMADGRDVPVRPEVLGRAVLETMPAMVQILVRSETACHDAELLERRLYVARRIMEKALADRLRQDGCDPHRAYVVSLSCRSIVYKGMLPGARLADLYPDLREPDFSAPFAVFHERFSTNTLPSWRLAQPFRHIAHNGEINTLRGNVARMKAREAVLSSPLLQDAFPERMQGTERRGMGRAGMPGPGADRPLEALLPVLDENGSDSAVFDNVLELLVKSGYSLPHALMMMVPEPFGPAFVMGDNKRAFYEYHAALMEPWDGPTAMVFTDGYRRVGALPDRNGLRPCRYSTTRDGLVVLASESGVVDIPPEQLLQRGQLRPRRMLMVDVERHRIAPDAELKGQVIRAHPYRRWLRRHSISLSDLYGDMTVDECSRLDLRLRQRLFGYSEAMFKRILAPMAQNAQEPVEAMGHDVALAVLDTAPQPLFNYFKQQFAQVTNPPIDPLREELSMSLMGYVGRERNLLEPGPEHCALLRLPHPFLTRDDMCRLRTSKTAQVRLRTLDATFPAGSGGRGLETALDIVCARAEAALDEGATLLVISDDKAGPGRAAIPILLATAALHHHLLRRGLRHLCGIIVETGEAREVMHMAQLIGYGAGGICPSTALDTVREAAEAGKIRGVTPHDAVAAYITALKKGLLKAFARLGISTLRSFRGAQTFEAVGLAPGVVHRYFTGTPSRLGGVGLEELAAEAEVRHATVWSSAGTAEGAESASKSVSRLWTSQAVRALHEAVRENSPEAWRRYAACSDEQSSPCTLRSLLRFKEAEGVPLEEVEPVESIVRRFVGAAMSFGSLGAEAHEAIAVACNRLGARSNCGEGGEDPQRNTPSADGGDRRSRIRQIASGRFGVTAEYLFHADEIQIKVAQGAKPGEGGQLPAHKVTPDIAGVRHTTPGVSLVSPPPHHDIYSIEDLAQLMYDLRRLQPQADVSVKLVSECGVGTVAVGVVKAGAQSILVSGYDGGTGASPLSAIQHVGLPWEMGLAETQQALVTNGLRRTVRIQVDGQLRTGRDLAVAILLGAEEFGFGSTLLVSLGCRMCRRCHRGNCPAGIATQEPELRARFKGTAGHVERFLRFMAEDLRGHMARLGFRTVEEMVGRVDRLEPVREGLSAKAATLDFSALLAEPELPGGRGIAPLEERRGAPHPYAAPDTALERELLVQTLPVLDGTLPMIACTGTIRNTDRAVGARLSGEVIRHRGGGGLPRDSIRITLQGSGGQSLGAFLTPGITLRVRGDANDYAGKGLSGGILIVSPDPETSFAAAEQAVVGNVALYGATGGEAYFCGQAGERFAVRNSGAVAVVEGVGDHGCEYMTGGTVVVLGQCGYNFAAGMSGGVAFVYDGDERFQNRCNTDSVDLESVWTPSDRELLHTLLEQHRAYTGSRKAADLLANWEAALPLFVKVMPLDYKQALERLRLSDRHGMDTASATEEVYPGADLL